MFHFKLYYFIFQVINKSINGTKSTIGSKSIRSIYFSFRSNYFLSIISCYINNIDKG